MSWRGDEGKLDEDCDEDEGINWVLFANVELIVVVVDDILLLLLLFTVDVAVVDLFVSLVSQRGTALFASTYQTKK